MKVSRLIWFKADKTKALKIPGGEPEKLGMIGKAVKDKV